MNVCVNSGDIMSKFKHFHLHDWVFALLLNVALSVCHCSRGPGITCVRAPTCVLGGVGGVSVCVSVSV